MPASEPSHPFNPLAAALMQSTAPRALKISAARGVLPLLRAELVKVLVFLLRDGDDEVRREAASRLASFPEEEILPLLADPELPAEVLDHFGCELSDRERLKDAVLASPSTTADTLRRMAPALTAAQIDQLLLNQTRLIASPDLIDLLAANRSLTPSQRARIDEFRRHFLSAPPATAAPPAKTPAGIEVTPASPASAKDRGHAAATSPSGAMAPARGAAAGHAGGLPASPAPVEAAAPQPAQGHEMADADRAVVLDNVVQKILRMNAAEKTQLALKGTREERSVLIKDSSKSVQEAVLSSPKLTENEVETIARMRGVAEDVLRIIAGHRDWMKNYTVIHSLATNPKTPIGIAINLVSHLKGHDLKILVGDKNVPEVIRRQARKVVESRIRRPGRY